MINIAEWTGQLPSSLSLELGVLYAITKAGIMLDDLVTAELRPRTLLEGNTEKRDRLMGAIDSVNSRFGRFAAVPATQGFKRD
ncbi:MAG: hypothetical protein ACOYLK_04125 [Sphingomonas sp.]